MLHREHDAKRRTVAHSAVDETLPPVQLDEALGQRKPQPGALGLAAAVLARAV